MAMTPYSQYSQYNLLNLPEDPLNQILFEPAFDDKNPEQEAYYKNLSELSRVNKFLYGLVIQKKGDLLKRKKFKNVFFNGQAKAYKKELFYYIKLLKNQLSSVDISHLFNCNDKDVNDILDQQKELKSFSVSRLGITTKIIPNLNHLECLKIKLPALTSEEKFEIERKDPPESEKLNFNSVKNIQTAKCVSAKFRDVQFFWTTSDIEKIVKQNPDLKILHLNGAIELARRLVVTHDVAAYLANLPLENLTLIGCNFGCNVAPELLKKLPKLKKLKLIDAGIEKIPALDDLTELQKLHLEIPQGTLIPDLKGLKKLEKLTIIEHSVHPLDFDFLLELPALKHVTLHTRNSIKAECRKKLEEKKVVVLNFPIYSKL